MGFLSKIFGGGGTKTSTVTSDPWENMPRDVKDYIRGRLGDSEGILDRGLGLETPVPGNMSPEELEALEVLRGVYEGSQSRDDLGIDYNSGIYDEGLFDPSRDFASGYTDDVVDTTLAGMARRMDQDAAAREGEAAAVGGLTNTRASVSDAIARSLGNMDMAEMEARLRDEGHRFGVASSLEERQGALGERDSAQGAFEFAAQMGLSEEELLEALRSGEFARGMTYGGALGSFGEDARQIGDAQGLAERDQVSWLSDLFRGTQADTGPVTQTQTSQTPKPSTFSQLLGAGTSIAGAFLSDERAKEGIEVLDGEKALSDLRALEAAEYTYRDGLGDRSDRHAGLIAQSATGISGAVLDRDDGLMEVSPYPIIATVVSALQELDRKIGDGD